MFAVPAAFAIRFVPAWSNESLLFIAAGVGTIPLAGWLGRATELLSARTGSDIGGFVNATFGNAAELMIALMALSKGLTTVVKASLTGSIIGDLLRARRVGNRRRRALFAPEFSTRPPRLIAKGRVVACNPPPAYGRDAKLHECTNRAAPSREWPRRLLDRSDQLHLGR